MSSVAYGCAVDSVPWLALPACSGSQLAADKKPHKFGLPLGQAEVALPSRATEEDALSGALAKLSVSHPVVAEHCELDDILAESLSTMSLGTQNSRPTDDRKLTMRQRLALSCADDPVRFRDAIAEASRQETFLRAQAAQEAADMRAKWEEQLRIRCAQEAAQHRDMASDHRLRAVIQAELHQVERLQRHWQAAREAELQADLENRVDAWRQQLQAETTAAVSERMQAERQVQDAQAAILEAERQIEMARAQAREAVHQAEQQRRGAEDAAPACSICLVQVASWAFVPCGHRSVCHVCVGSLPQAHRSHCPQCRGAATDLIRIW